MTVACVSGFALPAVIFCAVFSSTLGNVLMNSFLQRRRHQTKPRGEYVPTPSITVVRDLSGPPDDLRPYVGGAPVSPFPRHPTVRSIEDERPRGRERSDFVPLEYDARPTRPDPVESEPHSS